MKKVSRTALVLGFIVAMLSAPALSHADRGKSMDTGESAKRRIERERQFLYRSAEDLNRSQASVQAMARSLEKQIQSVELSDSLSREQEISPFLEWYRSYADWLGRTSIEIETDLSKSHLNSENVVQPDRYYSLADGYAHLRTELEQQMARLDSLNKSVLQRIDELRAALVYVTSADFAEERSRDRKQQPQQGSDRSRERRRSDLYERYKDITDAQIAAMEQELKNLERLQNHVPVLLEVGRMETHWIVRKIGDYNALGQLAEVVGREVPDSIEDASSRMIKRYDADIEYFSRRVEEISRDRRRIVPAGSMGQLDRKEELLASYEMMKTRYERQISWLNEQAGAYRADIIQLKKDK